LRGLHGLDAKPGNPAHLDSTGKPTQNAYIESFNGKFRHECLNENWFESLALARDVIAIWRQDYNEVRPHGTIGRIPPAAYAAMHRSQQEINNDAGSVNLQTLGPLSN
jgi:putative transposase